MQQSHTMSPIVSIDQTGSRIVCNRILYLSVARYFFSGRNLMVKLSQLKLLSIAHISRE